MGSGRAQDLHSKCNVSFLIETKYEPRENMVTQWDLTKLRDGTSVSRVLFCILFCIFVIVFPLGGKKEIKENSYCLSIYQ